MAITKWRKRNEVDPFRGIQSEINRLFDSWTRGWPFESPGLFEGEWVPAIDVSEDENHVVVKAELPGMNEKDIDVNLQNSVLTIRGEKKKEEEKKGEQYYRLESSYGAFQRAITLPSEVDSEKVKANFKNGVLKIELPKKETAKAKKVKVDVN